MKIWFKYLVVVSAISAAMVLSGCAHRSVSSFGGGSAGDQGAQTYGLTADRIQGATTLESLPDNNTQSALLAKVVNPMTAPASNTYYFAFDQSKMDSKDYPALLLQAQYLVKNPGARVRLEGNTDSRGSREYNIALGYRRDKSVQAELLQYGVAPNQIVMVSYGKERPAADGYGPQVWALNRRVNLVYEATS